MPARADLHLHSRYSDRSSEWLFRRLNVPASHSQPRALYERLRERGMNFCTLTDHDRIEGCLEIADRPGVFLSESVTTRFPRDRVKVSVLVWGLTERQHAEVQAARENIFDLQALLQKENLAHAVAHPLYRPGDRLQVAHVERLLLLFRHFEGLNGLRDRLNSETMSFLLGRLTPEIMERLAAKHGLAPTHAESWRKVRVGGSEDYGGLFAASAYTETPDAPDVATFLEHLRAGRCEPRGKGGEPLTLSHSLYQTLYTYAKERFGPRMRSDFLETAFSRFMEGRDPTAYSLSEKLGFLTQGVMSGKIFEMATPANVTIWRQFSKYFADIKVAEVVARETRGIDEPERRAFVIANALANQLSYRLFVRFVSDLTAGRVIESLQDISTMGSILLTLTPYLYALQSQAPSREWLADISKSVTGDVPAALRNRKRAWFTDTLEDVNGVATTIQRMAAAAQTAGHELMVVTSRQEVRIGGIPIKNFQPIGEFELPEYQLQKLSFPPILQMIDYIQREGFTELIISTPGPVGITALIAAKMLRIRACGIYHTDFPQYIRILTDDSFLETLTWSYMKWFYSQLDLIYVNSEHYRQAWIQRGIAAEKLEILPRGLDTELFQPGRREAAFRRRHGIAEGEVVLLFVGRISKEKDVDVIVRAVPHLGAARERCRFMVVGDGPYRAELAAALPEAIFTGYLSGRELAAAYASAEVFVFPSTTDTFGNVVIEAFASGLPAVVSDTGGPCELVKDGVTGRITRSLDEKDFARAVAELALDAEKRRAMSVAAREAVRTRDWRAAFERFWALSPE